MPYLTSAVTPVLLFFKSFVLTSSVIQIVNIENTHTEFYSCCCCRCNECIVTVASITTVD